MATLYGIAYQGYYTRSGTLYIAASDGSMTVTKTVIEANLSPTFFTHITRQYRGTRLGRQELDAEIIDDLGGLWSRKTIEECRVRSAGDLSRIIVAIDPAVTSGDESDETGIMVAGKGSLEAYAIAHGWTKSIWSSPWGPVITMSRSRGSLLPITLT
jgi:phage terminase large subunit-like protein